ncbi:MAG: response regulator, partial [Rhodoferax sp.]|nr:response regulator [Rhodoferax sp.]
ALATYKMACSLTPASVGRLQSLGMMSFYAGHLDEAEHTLRRTCLLGLDSKIFDCQSLVLMAFVQFERGDHKALQRCAHDFERLLEKSQDPERTQRLAKVVHALSLLQHHKIAQALVAVREMIAQVRSPEFDFESATNLLGLVSQLAKRAIQLEEVHGVVDTLGLRFSCSRAMSELLAGAAKAHPVYAEHVRAANTQVLKYAEYAMSLSMKGNPTAAVDELLLRGEETLNNKLVDSAFMVIERYHAKISDAEARRLRADNLRGKCTGSKPRAALAEGPRKAGALSLRVGSAKPRAPSK